MAHLATWARIHADQGEARSYTLAALPVTAVSPANGQLAPSSRAIQIQLNTSSSSWTSTLSAQFQSGAYGMRLFNQTASSVVWFFPKGASYSAGSLALSNAISFDKSSGIVTVQPGTLSLGATYLPTLATGAALLALLAQDLKQTYSGTGALCCAYPASNTPPWSFKIATVLATSRSGTSTSSTGTASATIGGVTTNAGTSSLSVSAVGLGTVTVASYPSSPTAASPSFTPSGAYFDVYLSIGNTFQSVTITSYKGGATLYWYTGAAWQRASPQKWSGGGLNLTITASSSPTLSQLTGTTFAGALPTVTSVSPGSGTPLGGDPIEITGSGFTGATSVQFQSASGSTPVPTVPGMSTPSFSIVSDTAIEIWTTPPGMGTVDITVTTLGGSSLPAATDQFTYAAATKPQTVAVPSYIYPGSAWTQMDNAAPTVGLSIINPNNGPGSSCNPDYAAQLQTSQSAGLMVLGYVYTRYANTQPDYVNGANGAYDRDIAAVERDIDTYYQCYPTLDGIFFDEASTDCTYASSYYGTLSACVPSSAFTVNGARTQIAISAPPGMPGTTVDVTVTSANGSSATTAADHFSYAASSGNLLTRGQR